MPLPVHCMTPELNMISAVTSGTDYVVFNVIVDSGCSSHTFNCLNYIDNYKVMIEEDHSSMVLADRSRVQIRGKGNCGVLGDVYYVPEIRNCLLSVRQMDRQGLRPRSVMGYVRCGTEQQGRSSYTVAYRRRMACIRCLKSSSKSS